MCSRPSRTDEPYEGEGHNQSPNPLSADLTTNQDLNGIANTRQIRRRVSRPQCRSSQSFEDDPGQSSTAPTDPGPHPQSTNESPATIGRSGGVGVDAKPSPPAPSRRGQPGSEVGSSSSSFVGSIHPGSTRFEHLKHKLFTYAKFIGPGFMISVAYSQLSSPPLCPTEPETSIASV